VVRFVPVKSFSDQLELDIRSEEQSLNQIAESLESGDEHDLMDYHNLLSDLLDSYNTDNSD